MSYPRQCITISAAIALCFTSAAASANHHSEHEPLKQAALPHERSNIPPSFEQKKFNLPISKKDRQLLDAKNLSLNSKVQSPPVAAIITTAATTACKDMTILASYSGAALASYVATLPDYECTYGLFSLTSAQAATVYSAANMNAIISRFTQEANSYNASNIALVNLALYLRAGYFLASGATIPAFSPSYMNSLRSPLKQLIDGNALMSANATGTTTASEVMKLITNLNDELYYLPSIKNLVIRYTNSASNPNAVNGLLNSTAAGGFTGALTILFYAHGRTGAASVVQDMAYPTALNNFVVNNKNALINTSNAYQLHDAESEAFRFMQYPAMLPSIKPMVKNQLATSSMTGVDSDLWLGAAASVDYYDSANCAEYGTCGYQTKLADAVLKTSYTCSATIKIRAQDMTMAQLQDSCTKLGNEETYFHKMLLTNNQPVASDMNKTLELVVFDDYTNYSKYAGVIYGMSTDNGGMYLEGNPADPNNQARFVAHEASWLRPAFSVWNLEHEYVHYLDGRFDMKGDFTDGTTKPTVWWIEGVAEYLSHKNNYQEAIDAAKSGTYKLSTIFGNTYAMSDYVNRAYRWGYMAVRFMNEKHRSDIDAMVAKFRIGDFTGYQALISAIGTKYDNEFSNWVQTATVAGEPPLPSTPVVGLPACASTTQLGKNCSIKNLSSGSNSYAYIMLPSGAKNLRLFTSGGTGDVDLYVKKSAWPSSSSYDAASLKAGNEESVTLAAPSSGVWYYISLPAKKAYSGVTLSATYE